MMNEQERELDLQLGDALAQIESYRLTRLRDGLTITGLLLERDALKYRLEDLVNYTPKLIEGALTRDGCCISCGTHLESVTAQYLAALGDKP